MVLLLAGIEMIQHNHGKVNMEDITHLSKVQDYFQPILLDLDYFHWDQCQM